MKKFFIALPIVMSMVGCTDISVGNYVLFPTKDTEYQKQKIAIYEADEKAKNLKKYNSAVAHKKLYIATIDNCIKETKVGIPVITVEESLDIKNSCEVFSANTHSMNYKYLEKVNSIITNYEMTGKIY